MRLFKYELDLDKLGLTEDEEKKKVNHKDTFDRYLQAGLNVVYGQGLDNKTSRVHFRIQQKLDASTDGTIQLEETEFDLVNEGFNSEKARFDAKQTRLVSQYRQAIEGAQKL